MADVEYLKSLQAVREQAHLVLEAASHDALSHFHYNPANMSLVADYVSGIITRDFGPDKFDTIPPHGRWQHFDIGNVQRVDGLVEKWQMAGCDKLEVTRRLVDLFFVSVLLDAGAGDIWRFTEPGTSNAYGRSEGLAVASLYMMAAGAFSSEQEESRSRVDGHGLCSLTTDTFRKHFQITPENSILSDASRVSLLNNVGSSLLALPKYFGKNGRPGNLVDYLLETRNGSQHLDFDILWSILQELLLPAWPKDRTHVAGVPVGDAWPLEVLARINAGKQERGEAARIQPFHKLTQWLAYSLSVPFMRILGLEWKNLDRATGLPEYRNGGLFIDLGVLKLKDDTLKQGLQSSKQATPSFSASGDVIVEWRAMTVALLDVLYKLVSEHFRRQGIDLNMPQMLEAGSWKGGREIAAKLRPQTKSSPILIEGDGTLF